MSTFERGWKTGLRGSLLMSVVLVFASWVVGPAPALRSFSWTQTTQADFMAGTRTNVDVRNLDALGTPLGYDTDIGGSVRLASMPGTWTKYAGNPILEPGSPGSWEEGLVVHSMVIYDDNSYKMWYVGSSDNGGSARIGYAVSSDGIHWDKYAHNPVLEPGVSGAWDNGIVIWPDVIYDGNIYKMWYTAVKAGIFRLGYAISSDGIHWIKYVDNPILDLGPPGSWDAKGVGDSSVIYDGSKYEMWYVGSDGSNNMRIGYAISPDGIHWTKYSNNPVLDLGAPGSWDSEMLLHHKVIFDGVIYKIWYVGNDGTNWRIGFATSTDGIHWTKYQGNPVLIGTLESWDGANVAWPNVIFDGNIYKMWYQGNNSAGWCTGYAGAPSIYEASGTLVSSIFDAGAPVSWQSISWTETKPANTNIIMAARTGNTPVPDDTWTDWAVVTNGGVIPNPNSRYIQYKVALSTSNTSVSPILHDVTITGRGWYE